MLKSVPSKDTLESTSDDDLNRKSSSTIETILSHAHIDHEKNQRIPSPPSLTKVFSTTPLSQTSAFSVVDIKGHHHIKVDELLRRAKEVLTDSLLSKMIKKHISNQNHPSWPPKSRKVPSTNDLLTKEFPPKCRGNQCTYYYQDELLCTYAPERGRCHVNWKQGVEPCFRSRPAWNSSTLTKQKFLPMKQRVRLQTSFYNDYLLDREETRAAPHEMRLPKITTIRNKAEVKTLMNTMWRCFTLPVPPIPTCSRPHDPKFKVIADYLPPMAEKELTDGLVKQLVKWMNCSMDGYLVRAYRILFKLIRHHPDFLRKYNDDLNEAYRIMMDFMWHNEIRIKVLTMRIFKEMFAIHMPFIENNTKFLLEDLFQRSRSVHWLINDEAIEALLAGLKYLPEREIYKFLHDPFWGIDSWQHTHRCQAVQVLNWWSYQLGDKYWVKKWLPVHIHKILWYFTELIPEIIDQVMLLFMRIFRIEGVIEYVYKNMSPNLRIVVDPFVKFILEVLGEECAESKDPLLQKILNKAQFRMQFPDNGFPGWDGKQRNPIPFSDYGKNNLFKYLVRGNNEMFLSDVFFDTAAF